MEVRFGSASCRSVWRVECQIFVLLTQKRTGRCREEFRTPLGVRKSPKNEPAVNSLMLMGIADSRGAWLGAGNRPSVGQEWPTGCFGR